MHTQIHLYHLCTLKFTVMQKEHSKIKNFSDRIVFIKQWYHISKMPGLTSTRCAMSAVLSNYKTMFLPEGYLKSQVQLTHPLRMRM